jgi:uncharacterized membrane protein
MSRYELFKLLHVVGAIVWVGAGAGLLVLNQHLVRVKDYDGLVMVGRASQSLGMRLFVPASLVTVAFGIALVATEPAYGFTDLWILIGFGGIVASGIAQTFVAERAGKRFLAIATEHGTDHPNLAVAARGITRGSVLDLGLLLVVVWAMVAKPVL